MEDINTHLDALENRIRMLKDDPEILDEDMVRKEILNYLLDGKEDDDNAIR